MENLPRTAHARRSPETPHTGFQREELLMAPTTRQLADALRFMGVPDGSAEMEETARRAFDDVLRTAHPRKIWLRLPLRAEAGAIFIGDGISCRSADLSRLFRHCRSCVVMAVTLGAEVDRRISALQLKSMVKGLAFDACASVMADALCDETERDAACRLKAGEFLTQRFSPGYGDVPLEFSAPLLKAMEAERRIGVILSARGMMIPVKSITALAGISDRRETRLRSCDVCGLASCQYRKEGGLCHEKGM